MSDNKNERHSPDTERISLNEKYEVEYWTNKFHVTPSQLKIAVEQAGHSVNNVSKWLKDHNMLSS